MICEMNTEIDATSQASTGYLWFLNSLIRIRLAASAGKDAITIIEHRVPRGDSPPLHSHRREDEIFYILEGDFLFQVNQTQQRGGPGDTLLVPQGTPHTYRVDSQEARYLTVTRGGDFEKFVRAFARPAERTALPPPAAPPLPEALAEFAKIAASCGIDLCGPPLQ
jgi:quercetin dioxygenase-like cupin family protein